jgi:acyl-coenzyme A thioesterase PaaI-like protein
MRPATEGTLHAVARRESADDERWLWDVDFRDDDGRRCASVRVIVAITPPRPA